MPSVSQIRDHVLDALPEFDYFPRRCEPDAYGASFLIAQRLGLDEVPESTSTWTHGWRLPEAHPEEIAQQSNEKQTNLVPTEVHARTLRDEYSYRNVHAVGCPFIYARPLEVNRIPNSLLVMPPHTLPYLEDDWNEKKYVSAVQEVMGDYEHVVACIHRHDIKEGNWVEAFDSAGIPYIPGTRVRDKYGLVRLQTLFHMFEAMTTNTIGSHVPYASYCGCKVSIYGPYAHRTMSDFKKDPVWSGDREPALRHRLRIKREEFIRDKYPFLFSTPSESETHIGWAKEELGEEYRREPRKLSKLLGWGFLEQTKLKINRYVNRRKAKIRRMVGRAATILGASDPR